MLSKHFAEEGIGSGFLSSSFGSVEDDVLCERCVTGKSLVEESCCSTCVMGG